MIRLFEVNNILLTTITLPESLSGTYFKIIIQNPPASFTISNTTDTMFGLLINDGTYTSVPITTTLITCVCAVGDYIEFYGLGSNNYYVNGTSSNLGGFNAT